jgi:hypothetical protein
MGHGMKDTSNGGTDKQQAHMERRRKHGLTYKQLGDEFGTSKSSAHRKIQAKTKKTGKLNLRTGFSSHGSASE